MEVEAHLDLCALPRLFDPKGEQAASGSGLVLRWTKQGHVVGTIFLQKLLATARTSDQLSLVVQREPESRGTAGGAAGRTLLHSLVQLRFASEWQCEQYYANLNLVHRETEDAILGHLRAHGMS